MGNTLNLQPLVLSTAEKNLINHLRMNGSEVFEDMCTTLQVCIINYMDPNAPESAPTIKALEAWCSQLEMMRLVHLVTVKQ